MSDKETVTLELDVEEGAFLNMGLALLLEMLGNDIEKWSNKKESSMDKLFFLMDTKVGVASLWRKVLISMGANPEDIAEHLKDADE
jgi:hypothetical protein